MREGERKWQTGGMEWDEMNKYNYYKLKCRQCHVIIICKMIVIKLLV